MTSVPCPVCGASSAPLDVVDFNKSCAESWGIHLPLCGVPVYYYRCESCGYCHAPQFRDWRPEDYRERIYNERYIEVDPDYVEKRPATAAAGLIQTFGTVAASIRHLDYGSGSGVLSRMLREAGWDSTAYDPYADPDSALDNPGRFDLITAYEIFEHVADVNRLMADISSLLAEDGVLILSTLLSDGFIAPHQRITWWYASPRNGHISLFSKQSLAILAGRYGFHMGGFSPALHVMWRTVPPWAGHFLKTG
ncbi:MAG: class I SAM-dependent methyltransferase [Gammaproteobacteria bacterium]|nr:class I SAM-dependent methyltransferase [Gammaproteobacteria bacterium]